MKPIDTLKRKIKKLINHSPATENLILSVYRPYNSLVFNFYSWKNTYNRRGQNYVDPKAIVWIKLDCIDYTQIRNDNVRNIMWKKMGAVEDGDWDQLKTHFSTTSIFISLKQHFVDSVPWRDTILYRRTVDEIENGQVRWNCTSVKEYQSRLDELDKLYLLIKKNGYKSQKDLITEQRQKDPISHIKYSNKQRIFDEVTVNIDRSGHFLFLEGKHRLSLAKLLNIEKIPARILIRHSQWEAFRNKLICYVKHQRGGRAAHQIPHPDLAAIPHRSQSTSIFQVIKASSAYPNGTLLEYFADVGGYFSHAFEEHGRKCFALEDNVDKQFFLKRIRRANKMRFPILSASMLHKGKLAFDTVIFLTHDLENRASNRQVLLAFQHAIRATKNELFVHFFSDKKNDILFAGKSFNPIVLAQTISILGSFFRFDILYPDGIGDEILIKFSRPLLITSST